MPKIAQGKNALVKFGRLKGNCLILVNYFINLTPRNGEFSVFSYFCFFINFLHKSQNKALLVLGQLLKSAVYDFPFNSILPFLVIFRILPHNLIINAN